MRAPGVPGRQGVRRLDLDTPLLRPGGGAEQADLLDVRPLAQKGCNGRADDHEQFFAETGRIRGQGAGSAVLPGA